MYKSCGIQVRLEGKTHEQFMDHWINVHAAKSKGIGPEDGLYGYVNNEVLGFVTPEGYPKLEILDQVDGIAQMWFDQIDGLQALGASPQVQAWFSDGPNYCGNRLGLTLEENVIKTPGISPRAAEKLFLFLQLKEEYGFSALDQAVRSLPEMPFVTGLCVSRVAAENASVNLPAFTAPRIDAVVELWALNDTSFQRAMDSEAGIQFLGVLADHYCKISMLRAREIVILPPVGQTATLKKEKS